MEETLRTVSPQDEPVKTAASLHPEGCEEPRPDGQEQAVKPPICKWATWSMVLGIIGIVLCFLVVPSLLAIIFGIIALVKISESSGAIAGKGRAIAGIILGGLWIVMIPFVAIVAAIAIPNLLTSRISANEVSAMASLKTFASAEAIWRQQDADGNGKQDYWTYDVSCLHRMYRAGGSEIAFIFIGLARADASPAKNDAFGKDIIAPLIDGTVSKSGYLFRAMTFDENGELYNQYYVNGVKATNLSKFAFVAYPETYGTSGVRTFIINEAGTIYYMDPGSDSAKIVLQWPGENPTEAVGPADGPAPGQKWYRAD